MTAKSNMFGKFCIVLMGLSFFCTLNSELFEIFSDISVYLTFFAVICGIIYIDLKLTDILILLYTCAYLIVSIYVTRGGIGSGFTYINGILLLIIISQTDIAYTLKKVMRYISIIIIIAFSLLSILYMNNYWKMYLNPNYLNPNTYSIYLMYAYMLYICFSPKRNISAGKIVLMLLTAFGTFNYASRAIFIAFLAFVLLQMFDEIVYSKNRVVAIVIILSLIQICFPVFYIVLYHTGLNVTVMGKSLFTGREILWINMFNTFGKDVMAWLIGLGSKVDLGKEVLNVHNNFMVVLVNFGSVGLVLYMFALGSNVKNALKNISNWQNRAWFSMFLVSILVLGISETVSFWSPTMIFAYFGLGMATNKFEEHSKELI